jgi:hypothetical protein
MSDSILTEEEIATSRSWFDQRVFEVGGEVSLGTLGNLRISQLERQIVGDPVIQFVQRADLSAIERFPGAVHSPLRYCLDALSLITDHARQTHSVSVRDLLSLRVSALLHVAVDILISRTCSGRWSITGENLEDRLDTFVPNGFSNVNSMLNDMGGSAFEAAVWSSLGCESGSASPPNAGKTHSHLQEACYHAFAFSVPSTELDSFAESVDSNLVAIPGLVSTSGHPLDLRDPQTRLRAIEFSDDTLRALASQPGLLRELSPDRFEHLVAELLRREGCVDVVVTGGPRDGGIDIWAMRKDELGTMLLLAQCKRHSVNPVDLSVVQRLYGAVDSKRATVGLVATTSTFTKPARTFVSDNNLEGRMTLKDFTGLARWLQRAAPGLQ